MPEKRKQVKTWSEGWGTIDSTKDATAYLFENISEANKRKRNVKFEFPKDAGAVFGYVLLGSVTVESGLASWRVSSGEFFIGSPNTNIWLGAPSCVFAIQAAGFFWFPIHCRALAFDDKGGEVVQECSLFDRVPSVRSLKMVPCGADFVSGGAYVACHGEPAILLRDEFAFDLPGKSVTWLPEGHEYELEAGEGPVEFVVFRR